MWFMANRGLTAVKIVKHAMEKIYMIVILLEKEWILDETFTLLWLDLLEISWIIWFKGCLIIEEFEVFIS